MLVKTFELGARKRNVPERLGALRGTEGPYYEGMYIPLRILYFILKACGIKKLNNEVYFIVKYFDRNTDIR